ncbi:MAG: helix-turn-helix domain-containing protein [Anaerolineae bacterium]
MGRLGQLLRRRREERGVSFAQIREATGIEERYAQALEGEEYTAFLSEVEAESYLRIYARFLGVNPWEAVELFRAERVEPVSVGPLRVSEKEGVPPSPLFIPLVSALTALLLVGLLALAYLILFYGS